MKRILASHGAHGNRRFPFRAKQIDRRVHLAADIGHAFGPELKALVAFAIRMQRGVVIHAGREIAPMRRRQRLVREFLEIHDAERVFRSFENQPFLRGGGQQRARGYELEKLAAVSHRCPACAGFPSRKSTSSSFSLVGILAAICFVFVSITAPPSG
jgi:hypothetical protein